MLNNHNISFLMSSIARLAIGLTLLSAITCLAAEEPCEPVLAQLVAIEGRVEVKRAEDQHWRPAQLQQRLCASDGLRTDVASRATVYVPEINTTERLEQQTTLIIGIAEPDRSFWQRVLQGVVYFFSRDPQQLTVETPYLNAAVEGTEFLVRAEPGRSSLLVFEGSVKASNAHGQFMAGSGEAVSARPKQAPTRLIVARPADTVEWALYYPPIIDYQSLADSGGANIKGVQAAIERQASGDWPGALAALETVTQTQRDPQFFALQASLYLAVGRVDEARVALRELTQQDKQNGLVAALQAIIAVTQNDRLQAMRLAQQGVEWSPDKAATYIALSYAQQAAFQLDEAQTSAHQAVKIAPNDALAWARLAELQLATGNLEQALTSARQAVELNPNLGQTHTLLGFAYLAQIDIQQAQTAFTEAIRLEQGAPLPRLGLGLALIRRNQLAAGRREIEIAVGLDLKRSLLRSYLGKAYFEEKRDGLADPQFGIAKELDPNDPTPWFYDAIRKQSENRPVEALQDLQESIALNDNRAVYRSRQLLDKDLAARSVSQGRIYQDLGFEQLALTEGWKSVNTDPGDYSGHRLLADSYASLPRHEIARSSELLQSQLLQPLNVTPIQPQLAESRQFFPAVGGPFSLSLNEFNQLFVRDGLNLRANAVAGSNSTFGDDVVVSLLHGPFSLNASQYHYESDGFRPNNDIDQDIYTIFGQWSLSPNTSLQAEYRHNDLESGELDVLHDPDLFSEGFRNNEEADFFRIGLRHSPTPKTNIIANLSTQNKTLDLQITEDIAVAVDDESYMAEIQYQQAWPNFRLIAGGGHASNDERETTQITRLPRPISSETTVEHVNLYAYGHAKTGNELTWVIGASGDLFSGGLIDRDQFNPKLGVIWTPTPATTLRGAAFRTLKRTLLTAQTIEPTQVAGFNQFFDDPESTEAWRYGLALDQKLSDTLYAGAELSTRDLEIPFSVAGPIQEVDTLDFEEELIRAYGYWAPHPRWAFKGEYLYEDLENDSPFFGLGNFKEVATHRVALGASFFHPAGLRASLLTTYYDQEGKFGLQNRQLVDSSNRFWVFDAVIGYRLPKRWGIVSLAGKNIFNEHFGFRDTDTASPDIIPERQIFLSVNLWLP